MVAEITCVLACFPVSLLKKRMANNSSREERVWFTGFRPLTEGHKGRDTEAGIEAETAKELAFSCHLAVLYNPGLLIQDGTAHSGLGSLALVSS